MAKGASKGISDRDKKILYIAGGILLIVLAYFLGFQKMQASRSEIVDENEQLESEVTKLRGMVARKASVEADTAEGKVKIEKALEKFPAGLRTESAIFSLDQLEKKVKDLTLESETFTMNQVFFMNGELLDAAASAGESGTADNAQGAASEQKGSGHYIGYRSDVSTTFQTQYSSLKKIIDFITQYDDRITISNLSISCEAGNKPLDCSMTVNMYSVDGQESKEYSDPLIRVPLGNSVGNATRNIFGTY